MNLHRCVVLCTQRQFTTYSSKYPCNTVFKKVANQGCLNIPFKGVPLVYQQPRGYKIINVTKLGNKYSKWIRKLYEQLVA